MKYYIEAGVVVRRQIRRLLMWKNIPFKEEKGWLDSVFYFDCSKEQEESIKEVLRRNELEDITPKI